MFTDHSKSSIAYRSVLKNTSQLLMAGSVGLSHIPLPFKSLNLYPEIVPVVSPISGIGMVLAPDPGLVYT